jgi:hypothetical protein
MGVLRRIMDAAIEMRGQIVYVNGEKTAQLDLTLPTPRSRRRMAAWTST